ncbi:MAG TPA: RHS repeat-associated core domain-containing protein [Candidatus Acidoferrales bacterium]|nr:RHS repeat-associated core domain-containing protein [Candidatus Acidoferrales bacterium]
MYNDLAYAPFGEQYAVAGTTGVTNTSFAGNNEDTTTNLYDAMNREYGIQGRWPSPDPAGVAAANPANPQSWNRYAYVMNNPLAFIDPSGFNPNGPNQPAVIAGPSGGSCTLDGISTDCGWVSELSSVGVVSHAPLGFPWVPTGRGSPYPPGCFTNTLTDTVACPDTLSLDFPNLGPAPGDLCGGYDCIDPGSGPSQPQSPGLSPQAQKCFDQSNAGVKKELQTFAGYADVKLIGRVVIGAGFGALSARRFLKFGGWGVAAGAVTGAVIGAVGNALSDARTIQNIQNSFMDKVTTCMQEPPGAPQ